MSVSSSVMNMLLLSIGLLVSGAAVETESASTGRSVQAVASARIVTGETVHMDSAMLQDDQGKDQAARYRAPLARSISRQSGDTGASINLTEFY